VSSCSCIGAVRSSWRKLKDHRDKIRV
jgi:hypothetical protein